MEQNLLVGNGINIQFGGFDVYSSAATMHRVVENIKAGKYIALTENVLSADEQLGLLDGMVKIINQIKAGKCRNKADGAFMLMDMDRITKTYPINSSITSVFLEDYFLAFEIFNNGFKEEDGEIQSESYRKMVFTFLRQILVDGIFNNGAINEVYKKFYPGISKYLSKFNNIFTINYDYNLENALDDMYKVYHLHGEFGKPAPEYDITSLYYISHKEECNKLIYRKMPDMEHIYSDAIMSWSWLDKFGKLIEPDAESKKNIFNSIRGKLEIVGMAPANDEHIFLWINTNPDLKSVVYYYFSDEDKFEFQRRIHKPVTYKKVEPLWDSMK